MNRPSLCIVRSTFTLMKAAWLTGLAVLAALIPSAVFAQSYNLKTIFTFNGTDSQFPADLTIDGAGNLYGNALLGGVTGYTNNGIVYKLTPSGVMSTLASFDGFDGDKPVGRPFIDVDGTLWGTTVQGGVDWHPEINHYGWGTVYRISSAGVFTPGAVEFTGTHGVNPIGNLFQDLTGNIVGITYQGGDPWNPGLGNFGTGAMYRLSPSGVISNPTMFNGGNGSFPSAGAVMDSQGNVYGTTFEGGTHGCGTLYKVSPAGELSILFNFDRLHGKNPIASVTMDGQGNLYGTTQQGGAMAINDAINGYGTVWKYSAASGFQTLVSFNGLNGMFPGYGVTRDAVGNLFGTTGMGGASGNGVVFELGADGTLSTLADFNGAGNGATPQSDLALDSRGNLFGVTNLGGATGHGTIFALQPVTSAPAVISSVALSPASIQGGASAQGTVAISAPAPAGGLVVTLGSNNSQVMPGGPITIPAGSTTASFTITTLPVTDNSAVAISARLGASTQQATLSVSPPTTASLAAIQVYPDVIQGGASSTGSILLNRVAPPGGTVVSLTSSSSVAAVPATVTVPAGSTTASFPISTSTVTSNNQFTLTATLGASSLQYLPIVTPASPINVIGLSVNLGKVQGQTPLIGRVSTSRPAPAGGVVISLASNNPAVVVPATVTMPEGVGITGFPIQTQAVSADLTATITASLGTTTSQVPVNVLAPASPRIAGFTLTPAPVAGEASWQGLVTLSTVAPAGGTVISLSADSGLVGTPSTVGVPEGESSVFFAVTTKPSQAPATAHITATLGGGTATATLTIGQAAPPIVPSSVTLNPSTVQGGMGTIGTVTLSGTAPNGGTVISLSSSSLSAVVPASVTVPPGANSASFSVSTQSVNANTSATITATGNGSSQSGTLTITTAPVNGLAAISVSPTTIRGGDRGTGTVTLTAPAPSGGAVVMLSSSKTSAASVPSSVTVTAGKTSATFTVSTGRPSSSTAVTISGAYGGVTKAVTITVTRH